METPKKEIRKKVVQIGKKINDEIHIFIKRAEGNLLHVPITVQYLHGVVGVRDQLTVQRDGRW